MRCKGINATTGKRCKREVKYGKYCDDHKGRGKRSTTKMEKIKLADKLFSLLIRKRGKCQLCGTTKNLQCAHVISRVNKHLRWSEDNGLCLCLHHHLYWAHKSPLEFADWFQRSYPIQYLFLMRERHKLNTQLGESIEFTIERLKKRLEENV